MMLNTDLCLAYKTSDKKFLMAADSKCCAWTNVKVLDSNGLLIPHDDTDMTTNYCGQPLHRFSSVAEARAQCCAKSSTDVDCDNAEFPRGPAFSSVVLFAASEGSFLRSYT